MLSQDLVLDHGFAEKQTHLEYQPGEHLNLNFKKFPKNSTVIHLTIRLKY